MDSHSYSWYIGPVRPNPPKRSNNWRTRIAIILLTGMLLFMGYANYKQARVIMFQREVIRELVTYIQNGCTDSSSYAHK